MFKLSQIISKPVISLTEAKNEGVVSSVIFDPKMRRLLAVIVETDSVTDAKYKRLDTKNIYKHDMDAIVIKTASSMYYATEEPQNPIGLPAYDHEGTLLGMVDDIGLDGGYVQWISCNGKQSSVAKVLSRSGSLVIFVGPSKPPAIRKKSPAIAAKRKIKTLAANPVHGKTKVIVHDKNTEEQDINTKPQPTTVIEINRNVERALRALQVHRNEEADRDGEEETKAEKNDYPIETTNPTHLQANVTYTPPPPNSKVRNYDFLLGKEADMDMLLSNGKVLVNKGDIITSKIIDKARKDHKLIHLALHCR